MLIESNLSKPSADRGLNVDHVAREADYLTAFKASSGSLREQHDLHEHKQRLRRLFVRHQKRSREEP